jgi:preprotein translocase subunit SecA
MMVLHQAVEAKEGAKVEDSTQTRATLHSERTTS